MKILNFGSLNIDLVYQVDQIVKEGETVLSKRKDIFCGGKGLNQSIALARAGVPVFHAGIIGQDGEILLQKLKENNIDVRFVKKVSKESSHTIIQVDQKGRNCIIVNQGENIFFTREETVTILDNFEKDDYILLQNELNDVAFIMEEAHKRGMKIILNPSPANEQLLTYPLHLVDLLVLNESEGSAITGKTGPDDMIEALKSISNTMGIVLTLGKDGSMAWYEKERIQQNAFSAVVVDTTAAGDTFTGYLISALVQGQSMQTAMKWASKAASIAVTRQGAADSIPWNHEIEFDTL